MKKYLEKNVYEAARDRIKYIFDNFQNIIVSVSGGKDSTVCAYLALTEANRQNRKIGLFFLDEEVVYQSTIDMIEYLMSLYPENTIRYWLQIPFNLTNATSFCEGQLHCWDPTKEALWMHDRKENNLLHKLWDEKKEIVKDKNKGFGFYDVLMNFEKSFKDTAFIVGLRADESLDRYRTMVNHPGYRNIYWSTKRLGTNFTFYPVYDWEVSDIWKFIGDNGLRYHRYYDFLYKKGVSIHKMRVSSLIHEKAFRSISDLPEFEFLTYEKLLARLKGVSFAQETAKNKKMFAVQKLPKNYKSWQQYRDFLLLTYPDETKKHIFEKRFSKHMANEYVARQQCRQLILNDYENNLPVNNREDPRIEGIKYWKETL